MGLLSRIESDFLVAYKAREQVKVSVLRMLKTAAKNKQVELRRPLEDEDVLDVLGRQTKQRQESVEQFRLAGREDLADKESAELEILRTYMPTPLTSAETADLVKRTVTDLGASGPQDMGRVMQAVMAEHKGRVDGKELSSMVRAQLSQ
jgi:uncharacterized protein